MLGVNVSLVSKDIPLRLKETDIVVSTPQAIATYPYSVLDEVETVVIDEADIQIDKRVGKHGRKDPLFNFMNHMLGPKNRVDIDDEKRQPATENRQSITEKRESNVKERNQTTEGRQPIQFTENPSGDDEFCRQFVFVGATMPDSEVRKNRKAMSYIRKWVPHVQTIQGNEAHRMIERLDIKDIHVEDGNKLKRLVKVISELEQTSDNASLKILVFVDTVKGAQKLYHNLTTSNVPSSSSDNTADYGLVIESADSTEETFPEQLLMFQKRWRDDLSLVHRDVTKDERLFALDHFNNATRSVLITTDVTARGLDFKSVDVVLQYDFAKNVTDMLHRVGRTARMGSKGNGKNSYNNNSLTLLNPSFVYHF